MVINKAGMILEEQLALCSFRTTFPIVPSETSFHVCILHVPTIDSKLINFLVPLSIEFVGVTPSIEL